MMVAGLRREASTILSRSWLTLQRLPLPERFGARSPWNLVSGNGPEWQRMQVVLRSSTSARPRAASPGDPVSDSGMPSPTIVYGVGACAAAPTGGARLAANSAAICGIDLAKAVRRDGLKPALGALRFAGADLAGRIEWG